MWSKFLKVRYFRYIDYLQNVIKGMAQRLIDPQKKIDDLRLRNDDLTSRLVRICVNNLAQRRERLMWRTEGLYKNSPLMQSKKAYEKLEQINDNLLIYIKIYLDKKYYSLRELSARLSSLSPAAILDRGYSITSTHPEGVVVRDPHAVAIGQDLEVMVAKGSLFCRVKGK